MNSESDKIDIIIVNIKNKKQLKCSDIFDIGKKLPKNFTSMLNIFRWTYFKGEGDSINLVFLTEKAEKKYETDVTYLKKSVHLLAQNVAFENENHIYELLTGLRAYHYVYATSIDMLTDVLKHIDRSKSMKVDDFSEKTKTF